MAASCCELETVRGIARAAIHPGHAAQVRQCYEDWATACVLGQFRRGLLVGVSGGDAFVHLAARDALAALAIAGIPADFRLALVALDAHLIAVYDAVVVAGARHGIEARRLSDEAAALDWLSR